VLTHAVAVGHGGVEHGYVAAWDLVLGNGSARVTCADLDAGPAGCSEIEPERWADVVAAWVGVVTASVPLQNVYVQVWRSNRAEALCKIGAGDLSRVELAWLSVFLEATYGVRLRSVELAGLTVAAAHARVVAECAARHVAGG